MIYIPTVHPIVAVLIGVGFFFALSVAVVYFSSIINRNVRP